MHIASNYKWACTFYSKPCTISLEIVNGGVLIEGAFYFMARSNQGIFKHYKS